MKIFFSFSGTTPSAAWAGIPHDVKSDKQTNRTRDPLIFLLLPKRPDIGDEPGASTHKEVSAKAQRE
jgi:hypothetical protein